MKMRIVWKKCVQIGPEDWTMHPVVIDLSPDLTIREVLAMIEQYEGPFGAHPFVASMLIEGPAKGLP